jgi:pyruvate dehydrogenase E2 component (dihydrolipoamide acetyltransferase)
MAKIIGLPKLSPTMEEGTLVRWVKQEGDALEVDDLIAEVETDKATMEFRSFDRGVLLKQLAPEGSTLAPDQPVAIIGNKGEDISALLKQAGVSAAPSTPTKAEPAKAEPVKTQAAPKPSKAPPPPAPAPERSADSDVEEGEQQEATAAQGGEREEERAPAGRVFASPVVRRIAREKDIDLSRVSGTGPHGRVIKRDVENIDGRVGLPGAPLRGPSAPPPAKRPAQAPAARAPEPTVAVAVAQEDRVEKLSQMRKTIARRLSESKRDVPHFYLTIDVDAEPLVAARELFNQKLAPSGEKISPNDMLIKACAVALRRFPRVNVSYGGDSMIFHEDVNISVAVAIPDGLVTPVLRRADRMGLLEISQRVREMAGRAKEKKLKPEEMTGGTFSISNLGMYGIDVFSAVINPPEAAILAVGAVRDEPVIRDGTVVPGKRLAVTLSCDHRAVDGAVGAEWLKVLRGLLESPLSMLL